MKSLLRFGVSIDADLIKRFDRRMKRSGHKNRSEALRDLIRAHLVEDDTRDGASHGMGVLTIVYDHHKRELEQKLTDVQHHHHELIIAVTHVHIDHDNCLEVIILKGTIDSIHQMADSITAMKGVKHSKLALTTTERHL